MSSALVASSSSREVAVGKRRTPNAYTSRTPITVHVSIRTRATADAARAAANWFLEEPVLCVCVGFR